MKSNWNLPPGVTMKDIDPKTVECKECEGTGTYSQDGVEGAWEVACPNCHGSGLIKPEQEGE